MVFKQPELMSSFSAVWGRNFVQNLLSFLSRNWATTLCLAFQKFVENAVSEVFVCDYSTNDVSPEDGDFRTDFFSKQRQQK